MSKIHKTEQGLPKLKRIRRELYAAVSTTENVKKIRAIEKQIARHEAQS